MPRLEQQVLAGGGELPLYVPGPLFWVSIAICVVFWKWLFYYTLYPYHGLGIMRALQTRRAKEGVLAYQATAIWQPARDIRTVLFPLFVRSLTLLFVWLSWLLVAFQRNWPGIWTPIQTFCHPGWQATFWVPMLALPAYILLWIASGASWFRPWRCASLRNVMAREYERILAKKTQRGSIGDFLAYTWFNVQWTYHAYGGLVGWSLFLILVWFAHDLLILFAFRINWKQNTAEARKHMTESLQSVWKTWQDLTNEIK